MHGPPRDAESVGLPKELRLLLQKRLVLLAIHQRSQMPHEILNIRADKVCPR